MTRETALQNLRQIRHALQKGRSNLKEAYGEDVVTDDAIDDALPYHRMALEIADKLIDAGESLTPMNYCSLLTMIDSHLHLKLTIGSMLLVLDDMTSLSDMGIDQLFLEWSE